MNFPTGKWAHLLVGDEWPDDQDLAIMSHCKSNRAGTTNAYRKFGDVLRDVRNGPLVEQRGLTAEDLRNAFNQGSNYAYAVAEKNSVKLRAYNTAYDSVLSLQHDLTSLAEEGNRKIETIEEAKQPTENKVAQILTLVQQYRSLATTAAAKCGGNIIDAIQRILDAEGNGQQARPFAQSHGADVGQMFRSPGTQQEMTDRITAMIGPHDAPQLMGLGKLPTTVNPPEIGASPLPQHMQPDACGGQHPPPVAQAAAGGVLAQKAGPSAQQASSLGRLPSGSASRGQPPERFTAHPPASASVVPGPPAARPTPTLAGSPPSISGGRVALHAETSLSATPPSRAALSPSELAHSFNRGLETGAPFSAPVHPMPSAPTASAESHFAHPVSTTPAAVTNAPVHAPVFDSPPPPHHATAAEAPPPQIVAAAAPVAPAAPPQPVGPLPSYGADLRPPVTTNLSPPAPPSVPPPVPAAPSSAPVNPSAGQSGAGQPAVVRQSTTPATPAPPPGTGIAAHAVAATATGAVVGTASADATAQARLQRLVNSVARQQPRLAWAAGDRTDQITVLTTDLASGWVPPGVELPSPVTLLAPARRRGNLEALLGDVAVVASYTPVHHLAANDDEPIATSTRPRSAPDINELGWELCQATQWRDGLPRLAHTLAKAASAGSGVLDSEVDLLHKHLKTVSAQVLDGYPDKIDAHAVGNWQLLAAIEALIGGNKTVANYHLAWFLAGKTITENPS